ncbi:MAG: hypothetical protein E6J35_07300 [Chloroflexi bacterium]|nr:MAG: hypothetical protein E6J35_07300 [Chloroflexota bacterium]
MAIAFASRQAGAAAKLRAAVAAAVPEDARVVRTASGFVTAVIAAAAPVDARSEGERLRARVATEVSDDELSAGVAGPKPGSSGAHFALVQAEQALGLGRTNGGVGATTHFDDLGAYRFVLGQPASEIRAFSDQILGPLAADERNADLVKTLDAYLRLQGSVNGVARELYLHRNTVRHRLRRIAKLTGADLTDADSLLALRLAILGRQALARLAS